MMRTRLAKKPHTELCSSFPSNRWSLDGDPSSMSLLVQWLETSGNYDRWRDSPSAACQDAAAFLQENGIDHRSAGAIGSKIRRTEQQWEYANTWLTDSGLFDAYERGEVDDEIRANVNKLCPRYDRVAPVFRNAHADRDEEMNEEGCDADNQCGPHRVIRNSAVASKEVAEKKFSIDEEEHQHRQELFKCEFEAKRVQADVEIVCARVLGRQRLLDAGVDPKVVDDALPPL